MNYNCQTCDYKCEKKSSIDKHYKSKEHSIKVQQLEETDADHNLIIHRAETDYELKKYELEIKKNKNKIQLLRREIKNTNKHIEYYQTLLTNMNLLINKSVDALIYANTRKPASPPKTLEDYAQID